MALVGDDEIVIFDRLARIVADLLLGLVLQGALRFPEGGFFIGRIELGLAGEHRVETLNSGDVHLPDIVEYIGLQMLDVVKLGEFPPVIGGDKLVKLLEGLATQVVTVDQEEHPFCFGVLDQTVDEIDGGEGLAAAGGHLDQGAGTIESERSFQVVDGLHLGGPQIGRKQRVTLREGAQTATQRAGLGEPTG